MQGSHLAASPSLPRHQNLSRRLARDRHLARYLNIERRWDIELFPKAATAPSESEARSITGHIDFLKIRNGAIHILDYKPDATSRT
jgi:ATP-dependent exoDNAse (exonuclease V) beta subunit